MSHLKERREKNCLNCNAEVQGRYCHICGQENVEIKESFWALVTHLVYDIIHFDSKFFSTLKYLLLKPGFLSKEYLRGKRASYLHPIRMYVFASAIFFLMFFSFVLNAEKITEGATQANNEISALKDSLAHATDTAKQKKLQEKIALLNQITANIEGKKKDTLNVLQPGKKDSSVPRSGFHISDNFLGEPETIKEYNEQQDSLPAGKKDSWIKRMASYRAIAIHEKYKDNPKELQKAFVEKFLHSVPQMMFVSLPAIALLLYLLYIRRRKQFFYADHAIFIIHVYIAIFISLLVYYSFSGLYQVSGFSPFHWLATITLIYIFMYCFMAMYRFYGQGIFKTAAKYLLLLFLSIMLTGLLLVIFIFSSLLQV